MANTTPFQFPQFNIPGMNFPFPSLPAQASAAFAPQQFSNGSQYGRWNGVNNNAFGLFPNQFRGMFGFQPGGSMAFQPPYGNNGGLGSNQGPGANPGGYQGQMPQLPSGQMPNVQPQSAPQGGLGGLGGLLGGAAQSGSNFTTPPSAPTSSSYRNFQFSNPTQPFEQNFNQIMQQAGPAAAYSYIFNAPTQGQGTAALQQQLGAGMDHNTFNNLVNAFSGGGNNNYASALGFGPVGYGSFGRNGFTYQPAGTNRSTANPYTFRT